MKELKNIDDLFKEQLQSYEATPSPDVWNAIQNQMKEEKEDRKVIPIWWKLGGVAAVLALLLISNVIFDPFGNATNSTLVDVDTSTERTIEEDLYKNSEEKNKNGVLLTVEDQTQKEQGAKENSADDSNKLIDSNDPIKQGQVASEKHKNSKFKNNSLETTHTANKSKYVPNTGIANTTVKANVSQKEDLNKSFQNPIPIETSVSEKINTAVVSHKKGVKDPLENSNENFKTIVSKTDNTVNSDIAVKKNSIEKTDNVGFINSDKTIIPENNSSVNSIANEENIETPSEENKKSIFDAIEEDNVVAEVDLKEKDLNNWEVTPNFGPVFYNSVNGGSSIDPAFADNAQQSETNFSYGVQISYALNKRLSIRSGVSNVNLGYTTEGLEFASGPTSAALSTINYGSRQTVTTAVDRGSLDAAPPTNGMNPFENLNPKSTGGNARLTQNLSYYEVPLELNYALIDNKFGVRMIGGISTLFLGNNEIVANDNNFREVLGEANNLNSVSFSTNVGLGFNYKISKKLKFNIEPMFKYQLNPYTDSSVDFKPYYLGIYSGLSFKF